jgi:adenylate cyclase
MRPVRLRIGLGAGPMAADVVGTRRFFYDVWGDAVAVNIASRMESTGVEGKVQECITPTMMNLPS